MPDEVVIKFIGDEKSLTQSLNRLSSEFKALEAASSALGKKVEGALPGKAAVDKSAKELKRFETITAALGRKLEAALPNKASLDRITNQLKKLAKDSDTSLTDVTNNFLKLQGDKGIGGAVLELKRLNQQAKETGKTLNQEVAQTLNAAAAQSKQAAEQTKQANLDIKQALKDTEEQANLTSAGLLKIGGVAAAIAGGTALLGVEATKTGIEFERLQTALATSLGSENAAQSAFQEILQFAKETPFQVQEVTESFVKLQNQGIEPSTENLKRLGDIAASQGKSFEQITEAILDAAQGEGERLKEFGIRASFAGEQAEIAFKDVNLQVEKTPAAITEAVLSLGKLEGVAGGMEAQSNTLGGSLSNLQDNVDQLSLAFFEISGDAIKSVIDSANALLAGFIDAPPVIQRLVVTTTALTGALAAAIVVVTSYNVLQGTKIALELQSASSAIASTLSMSGLATATTAAATATAGFIATIVPLVAKLALIVGAVESVRQAYLSVARDGGEEFRGSTNNLRAALADLEVETGKVSEGIEEDLKPARRSWTDFFGQQARREVNQARIAVGEFQGEIGNVIDEARGLGDSAEDTAKKQELFTLAQKELNAQIEALDIEQLGTEAYKELKGQLEVSQKELDRWAGLLGVSTAAEKENAGAIGESKEAIKARTEAQIDAIQKQREAEKLAAKEAFDDQKRAVQETREDEGVASQRKRDEEKRKRDLDFNNEIEAIKTAQEIERGELKKQQESELATIKEANEEVIAFNKKAFEEELLVLKDQQAAEEKELTKAFNESERLSTKAFNEEIEATKDANAKRREDAERALADEIATRLEAQTQAFSEASKEVDQIGQLAAAETKEQRAALQAEFARLERQQQAIANLNLADQVFDPDTLIGIAKQVAGVTAIQTEDDAKKVQEALRGIEEEQRRQQQEADEAAKTAFAAKQREEEIAFQEQLEIRQEEFRVAQELRREEEEIARQQRQREAENALGLLREEQERHLATIKAEQEAALLAIKEEQELRLAALKTEQETAIAEKTAQFQEKERQLQYDFEDRQRAEQRAFNEAERDKDRAFNEAERQKDEASAARVAALKNQASASSASSEDPDSDYGVIVARKTGGAVKPGQTYLVGERNPEPLVFRDGSMTMVGANSPQLITVDKPGTIYPSLSAMPLKPTLTQPESNFQPLINEIRALNRLIQPSTQNSNNVYNIVGAQNPVAAAIKLQQEQIRNRARSARL